MCPWLKKHPVTIVHIVRREGEGKEEEEKAEGLKENSVKVSAPTLHSSMVCETVENGNLKRLVCMPPDLTEETRARDGGKNNKQLR